jgi:hypothetical protein
MCVIDVAGRNVASAKLGLGSILFFGGLFVAADAKKHQKAQQQTKNSFHTETSLP